MAPRLFCVGLFLAAVSCAVEPGVALDDALPESTLVCPAWPARLDFGSVPVGGVATRVMPAEGTVNAALSLTGASEFTATLTAEGLAVTVRPTARGAIAAALSVVDSRCGTSVVDLSAQGAEPCLVVSSAVRVAATERTCGSETSQVLIENRCDVRVELLAAPIDESPDGSEAWCAGGSPCREWGVVAGTGPIEAGETRQLTVRFTPANVAEVRGTLRLVARERGGDSTYTVTLTGSGLGRPTRTERFPPMPRFRWDVVLVVDTSPSMAERRAQLEQRLAWYARTLRESWTDSRVIVTTTERSTTGAVVGVASSLDADFEAQLARLVRSAPPGTEDSSCLEAALGVLEAQPSSLRSDAQSSMVLCITDGVDRATGPWQPLVGRLMSRMHTPRFDVVGPFGGGCTPEVDDGRLASLAQATTGETLTICEPWALQLFPEWFGVLYVAQLPEPILRVARVSVDGLTLPEGASWSWDSARNAVVVSPLYVFVDRELQVDWEPPCAP